MPKKPSTAGVDNEGRPPILHALPLEEAEKKWQDYLARCPGTYLECMASGRGEERAKWVLEGFGLEAEVNVARALAGQAGVKRPTLHYQKPRVVPRKSAAHFVEQMMVHVRLMEPHPPGSPAWQRERSNASAYRSQAVRRALEDQDPIQIPELPRCKRRSFRKEPADA